MYTKANDNPKAIKVIMFFTDDEHSKVFQILNDLGLTGNKSIVLIDARKENKVQASKSSQFDRE